MDKGQMILALVKQYTSGNKAQFASLLGVSAQTISAWINRKTFDAELIYTKCRDVSPEWLLTGNGNMLKSEHQLGRVQAIDMENNGMTQIFYEKTLEQAQEIGRLEQRIKQLESRLEKTAHDASTGDIVNVG